jgi:hypothetical protein
MVAQPHKPPSLDPTLSQRNSNHILPPHFAKIRLHTTFPSTPRCFPTKMFWTRSRIIWNKIRWTRSHYIFIFTISPSYTVVKCSKLLTDIIDNLQHTSCILETKHVGSRGTVNYSLSVMCCPLCFASFTCEEWVACIHRSINHTWKV